MSVVAIVLVGAPLLALLRAVAGEGISTLAPLVTRPATLSAASNTLLTSIGVVILAVPAAVFAALVTERTQIPGRRWLRLCLTLPLIVPPFVSALGWTQAYGPSGLLDDAAGLALPGLFGGFGIVLVIAVHAMPLAYLVVAAGLASRVEPDLARAARASGADGATTLLTVILPLTRPAIAGASALVFVTALNSFGVPAVLGIPAGFLTTTTGIYRDLAFAADPVAFSRALLLAFGLVVVTLAVVGAADAAGRRQGHSLVAAAPAGPASARRPLPAGDRRAAVVLWGYLALTSGVPLGALLLTALTRAIGLPPIPSNWTLANFAEVLTTGRAIPALGHSLLLAATAATLVALLGGLLAAVGRRRGTGLGTIAVLTFAIPGSALAVAVLLAYGPWLRDTLAIILVAYLAKFWALGHRPIAGSLGSLTPDVMRVARISGAGPIAALRTITLPLLRPALIAAWSLVFLFAFHEVTMSSLLYGPGSETLAVLVLDLQQLGDTTLTAALAVVLTLLVLAAALPVLLAPAASSWLARSE